MKRRQAVSGVAFALVSTLALGVGVRAVDKDKKAEAPAEATVQFAMAQPQPPAAGTPGTPDNSSTHFLTPDDATIRKGGSVTFVVNGGGHGIAVHPVSRNTTRAGIAAQLCNNGIADEADRRARNAVCNGRIVTNPVDVNGTPTAVTGTDNLNYEIADGNGDAIIVTGFNLTAANSNPSTVIANPRVDDAVHTHRLLATSGRSPIDTLNPATIVNNPAGAFLTGTAFNAVSLVGTPGQRIQVRFDKAGRYLVICMNRSHALNDHMFGFINVVGGEDDDN
jgi:plastocyanin